MLDAGRHVRRLRLHAGAEGMARRAVLLMEDAMRTASLPDAGGRIVLVRRLALGRIDPRAPPQTLALALERGMARIRPELAYAEGDQPRAGAVWFRDALDAHTRLALRVAGGKPVDAWYWPLAVPAWRPRSPVHQALRDIARSLAALPEAPSALPQWAAALWEAGHAERLVEALRVDDVEPLARAAQVSVSKSPEVKRNAGVGAPFEAMDAAGATSRAFRRTRPRQIDPRHELLRALVCAAGVATAGASARGFARGRDDEPTHRAGDGGAALAPAHWPAARPEPVDAAGRLAVARPEPIDGSGRPGARRNSAFVSRAGIDDAPALHPLPPAVERVAASGGRPASANETARDFSGRAWDGSPTEAGGLLFLVPVLVRVGFPGWIEAHPEWARFDLARRVFAATLARLNVAVEDPAWLLAAHHDAPAAAPRRFVAPALWREGLCAGHGPLRAADDGTAHALWDASGHLLLGAWQGACPRTLAPARRRAVNTRSDVGADRVQLVTDAWLAASRRWLRRFARIGLASLVSRPAAIALTPTHADVHFDLICADLRVRRAGLDLDPGWVPWLGRVVTFGYGR
jgi:hypothetical protein